MNSWTRQQGYPVVSVKFKDQKLEFEQVFFSDFQHIYFIFSLLKLEFTSIQMLCLLEDSFSNKQM